jgi:hypothetical protein
MFEGERITTLFVIIVTSLLVEMRSRPENILIKMSYLTKGA